MLVIIAARGGSKGLKDKNIINLNGKPLIAHTIESALNAKKVSQVIVSTDSIKIAKISKKYGAEVPFLRPKKLSNSNSNILLAYRHTLSFLERKGKSFREFVALGASCPLTLPKDIDNCIDLFYKTKSLTLLSVKENDKPIQWALKKTNKNKITKYIKAKKFLNRQEYEKTYIPNGSIYVFNVKSLLKNIINNNDYMNSKSYCYLMPKNRSIDIDDFNDLMLAKFYSKK